MRFRMCVAGAVLLGAVAPPAHGAAPVASAPTSAPSVAVNDQMAGQVYLMRGIANMFSYGLDDLARDLRAQGIDAHVHAYQDWPDLARQAVHWSLAHEREPVVIIGHSLGADAALSMAARMSELGVRPLLVITFDPVLADTVERTGGRFLNYYQSNNGFGRALVAGSGFTGDIDNRDMKGAPGLNHFNLEKSAQLHAEVVETLTGLLRRGPPPRQTQRPRAETRPFGWSMGWSMGWSWPPLAQGAVAREEPWAKAPGGIVATNMQPVR